MRLSVAELERFTEAVISIEREGFATPGLHAIAVQDAVQSLIRPVLVRWSAELVDGPLPGWVADGRPVDESLGAALQEAVDALPHSCGQWAKLVKAPAWGAAPPAAQSVRAAVLAAADKLVSAVRSKLQLALQGAFKAWARERRAQAKAKGTRAPKLKQEKAITAALEARIGRWSAVEDGLAGFVAALPLLDLWCAEPGRPAPGTLEEFVRQESAWKPDINDGVRVNIAPLQRAGLLAADALAGKDILPAIADRAVWRADERRWVRQGNLSRPGWWPVEEEEE